MKYKKKDPLVSIIMNCFNGERYLNQAIQSVLAQTYQNWEIIFWNNKSSDNSEKIFKSYSDNRFHYFCGEKHTFLYDARNYALSKCSGELIAFLDVDDIWFSKKLETQVPLFNDVTVGLSCGNYIKLDEGKNNNINLKAKYLSLPNGKVLNELFESNFVHMSTLMIRKKALNELKYFFDPRFEIIGDLDILLRLSCSWNLASIQQPIANYRYHLNNTGFVKKQLIGTELKILLNEIKDYREYKKLSNFSKFEYTVKYYELLNLLYNGKKWNILKQINSLNNKHRFKFLMAMFLPNKIIKILIDRS
jgi:glycosyltransferase involved in cell wall biosynthesis